MPPTRNLLELMQDRGDKGPKMANTTKQNVQSAAQPLSETQPSSSGHQQDLIRLLAQHFNTQFYQMTANNNQQLRNVNTITQTLPNFSNNATGGALNFHSPLAVSQYTQNRQLRGPIINYEPANSLLSNLTQTTTTTTTTTGLPSLGNQMSRSHQQQLSYSGPSTRHNNNNNSNNNHHHHQPHGQQHDVTPPLSTTINNPMICNPLFGDSNLNLFNALNCFNVTSDQFLLSLQQQYLLQAATTVRQIESRQIGNNLNLNLNLNSDDDINRTLDASSQDEPVRMMDAGDADLEPMGGVHRGGGVNSTGVENNNGRELLKFSINTILGRGSPARNLTSICDIKINATNPLASTNKYLDERAGGSGYLAHEKRDLAHTAATPDCDLELNTTDIDSCSSLTSTTPQPSLPNQMNNPLGQCASHPSASGTMSNNHRIMSVIDPGMDLNQQQHQQHQQQHQANLTFLSGSSAFPWTVAARGKPRRGMMRRAVFSDSQRVGLEKRFQLQKYISKPDRKKLAEKLGLRDSQVKIWFQNRRMKWRNSKERELLSAGGSREQTLPTRNNPNPDLSDVGETIKRIVSGPNSIGAA